MPYFEGRVLVDLEKRRSPWGGAALPPHIPLVTDFIVDEDAIPRLEDGLYNSLKDISPFTLRVKLEKNTHRDPRLSVRLRLAGFDLMQTHLAALGVVRKVSRLRMQHVGDGYVPTIETPDGQPFYGNDLQVDMVTLALQSVSALRHHRDDDWIRAQRVRLGEAPTHEAAP